MTKTAKECARSIGLVSGGTAIRESTGGVGETGNRILSGDATDACDDYGKI